MTTISKKTALHADHVKAGAKMGEFAGYDMPLYYSDGVIAEHNWVRSHAGLFDVSHMGQVMVKGPDGGAQALDFIEKLTPSNFRNLSLGRTKYTVLTNENGGIIDDLMVTCADQNAIHMVLNAGCKDKDIDWIKQNLPQDLEFKHYEDWALLALQGPKAEAALSTVLEIDLSGMSYMDMRGFKEDRLFISRLGYTGEDGFEIAVHNSQASTLWQDLCAHEDIRPAGLAARDSLRLEMGYPLYGHDIDDMTSPVEADLAWIIRKKNQDFIGAERIVKELRDGAMACRRIGLILMEKGIAREGCAILDDQDTEIGRVTSGGYSPILEKSIAMGYVDAAKCQGQEGTELAIQVRGRKIPARIMPYPFVEPGVKKNKNKA